MSSSASSRAKPGPTSSLSIVDASNLERNLYLTTQVLELGVPVVVALNMIDVAEGQGLRIDVDAAEPAARRAGRADPGQQGQGAGSAAGRCVAAGGCSGPDPHRRHNRRRRFPRRSSSEVGTLRDQQSAAACSPFLVRRLLLDVGGYTEKRLAERHGTTCRSDVQAARRRLAEAGCPVPAVEARRALRLDSRGDGRLRRSGPPSGPSPGPTASTAC